jgi:hypothetical protein
MQLVDTKRLDTKQKLKGTLKLKKQKLRTKKNS